MGTFVRDRGRESFALLESKVTLFSVISLFILSSIPVLSFYCGIHGSGPSQCPVKEFCEMTLTGSITLSPACQ